MRHYIIDGNNLLGKLNLSSKTDSRIDLAFKLENYFLIQNKKITLHFDGHPSETIKLNKVKLNYSYDKTADEEIKFEIEISKNPKLITLISSDHNLIDFAKACSCKFIKSEDFANQLKSNSPVEEEKRIKDISTDEIKKLFGVD